MGRFLLYTVMAFTTAFVGISWAVRGFPVSSAKPQFVAPLRATVDSRFEYGDPVELQHKEQERLRAVQSDEDPKLDAIRMDALQAANAYEMSPCDATMKSNLIGALTVYTRAWQNKLDCARPFGMPIGCDKKLEDTAAAFSTPLDLRLRNALQAAFDQKGIVKADFPDDVRFDVLQFAGSGLWHEESPICLPRQRASANSGR
jgi:hypothetical protein